MTDNDYRVEARAMHDHFGHDGIEIVQDATVEVEADGSGAWVMAWVFVKNDKAEESV